MSAASQEYPRPQGDYVAAVRESCRECAERAGLRSSPAAIDSLLDSPYLHSSYAKLSKSHGVALPLMFPNALAELNLLSLLALLNFGSSFRVPLHERTGRGTYDNIRALLLSLYLDDSSPSLLSAPGMQAIGKEKVAELLRVSIHEERPHPTMPAVVLGELRGPMFEFVSLITGVLNETGEILVDQGYQDLGSFIAESLKEAERVGKTNGKGPEAGVVLERLARAFPAFRDMSVVNDQPVYILKKALFLLHSLSLRFSSRSPPPFPIPITEDLPSFADNVLPSMLVHVGVISLSEAVDTGLRTAFASMEAEPLLQLPPAEDKQLDKDASSQPPTPGPTLSPAQVTTLRAAAITALDDITFRAHDRGITLGEGGITAVGLDGWLWTSAKARQDWRKLGRFVENQPSVYF
ncbi:hypothetical protein CALCODRAFT_453739 [Calocera cornea HHB12733]|uniref:Queuosine 5'-phosphate N-glycosylase/hydrolase n=1 Tax=Calocera cornea HHB12733 TaxID=1353952 RepID=A0A165FJG1_9BASI|nr:hypothetical protein CALCODRAFT_453739 [Calocera cornea HHB12733]